MSGSTASTMYVGSTSGTVAPAMARSSMVTTSSVIRRPFGKPAGSPPISPRMLNFLELAGVGGIDVFSRSMSAGTLPVKFVNPLMMPDGSR